MFSTNHAFAASDALKVDPFGITQYAYTQRDIDAIGNSQDFWDNNCVDGPLATFSDATNTVTFSPDWVSHQTQDPDTMQAVTNTVNPCGLIHVGVISSGGLSNTQLLPASALNPDPDPETPTSTAP